MKRTLCLTAALGLWAASIAWTQGLDMDAARGLVQKMREAGSRMGAVEPSRQEPGRASEEKLEYTTSCVVSGSTAYGYVANQSGDTYTVSGMVKMYFAVGDSMSRRALDVHALASVPPGQSVQVAWAPIPFVLEKGETCSLDVSAVIRK